MKNFALILIVATVEAISINKGGVAEWVQSRGDDWRDGEVEKYGGARAFNPDWASKQNGTWGVDFGKGVNSGGDEPGSDTDTEGEGDEPASDNDTEGEGDDNGMNGVDREAWATARQAWKDARPNFSESDDRRADQQAWKAARPDNKDYRQMDEMDEMDDGY